MFVLITKPGNEERVQKRMKAFTHRKIQFSSWSSKTSREEKNFSLFNFRNLFLLLFSILFHPQASSTKVHSIDNKSTKQHHANTQNVLHDKSPLGTNILGNIFVKKGGKSSGKSTIGSEWTSPTGRKHFRMNWVCYAMHARVDIS